MEFLNNKFFISLLLIVVFFSFSARIALAGGSLNFFKSILNPISIITSFKDIFSGNFNFGDLAGPLGGGLFCFLGQNGAYWSGCAGGTTSTFITANSDACGRTGFQIPITFYNFQMNTNYYQKQEVVCTDIFGWGNCNASCDNRWWCRKETVKSCVPDSNFRDADRQIEVYRLSVNSGWSTKEYVEDLSKESPNGFLNITNGAYHSFAPRNRITRELLFTTPYSNICQGAVCKFIDGTAPENSYIIYVARITGNYTAFSLIGNCQGPFCGLWGNSGNQNVVEPPPDCPAPLEGKIFSSKSPDIQPTLPWEDLGDAFIGPYQTPTMEVCQPISGSCGNAPSFCEIPDSASLCSVGTLASAPVLSESTWNWTCNGSNGGSDASCGASYCLPVVGLSAPAIVEYPNNINLTWTSTHADSCSASGDWSGSKSASGTEPISKPRGAYTFTLTCKGLGGTSLPASATVKVIKVPKCSFFPTPSKIILPQSSTLFWSCEYADNCAIDQGIGSISNTSGSHQVRPSKTTTYTLTCSSPDASRSYTAKIDVGATPDLKEINPR